MSAIRISGLVAKLATIPKTIIGATRPTASEVFPTRFFEGPSEQRAALRIRNENNTSKIIGSSTGGALTPAAIPPVSNDAGKKRAPSNASVLGPLAALDG